MTSPDSRASRRAAALSFVAVAALLVMGVAQSNFVDPDVWHEMALIRQAVAEGALPWKDDLAYTRTVEPSIHHEWGTGAILFSLGSGMGGPGLLILKFAL
ncbi:MAG TPA: hypothetical protein VFD43_08015, partial [Planctomycetota bacterium]|nr:hypothetical protein [Planctomycetota bacterium]